MSLYQRAPSPSPYANPSPLPYGPPSPVPPTQPLQPPPNSGGGQIQPGTITYTTSTSPDGKITYHPFKAVPVSYQTSNGVVSGIQWVPAEATSVMPQGARQANADFMSSWNRGRDGRDDKTLREWQKDEEHRIRKEEKEAARRRKERERRATDARGPPGSPYGTYTNPMNDLERRMDGVDLGRNASVGDYNRSPYQAPIAPPSPNMGVSNLGYPPAPGPGYQQSNPSYPPSGHGPDIYRAPSPYRGASVGAPEQAILSRSRAPSPNPMGGPGSGMYGQRAPSPIPGAMPPYGGNRSRAPSPIPGGGPPGQYAPPLNRSRAPSPIPGGFPPGQYAPPLNRSRAPSPLPGAPPPYSGQSGFPYPSGPPRSPRVGGGAPLAPEQPHMLSPPDGFSRPANLAQSYTFFDTMKIQDMDDFYDNMPRMPKVLVPHDVYHEDWIRFIQDLALAWAGKLPTSDQNRSSRPSAVAAELVDLWNNSFFTIRGVEVVLFKGHERRSGPYIGQIDRSIPGFDSDSDSSDLSTDSSGLSDNKYGRGAGPGYYGSYPDSKRRKADRKAEKKRKNKEKKARRRARERERTYALYISCITPRDGALGAPY